MDGANDVGPNGANSYLKKADYENAETHVLTGGAVEAPGERVTPGVLEAFARYGELGPPDSQPDIQSHVSRGAGASQDARCGSRCASVLIAT